MKKKVLRFEIYRYQLLPKDRFFQGELFSEIKSVEDLLEKKNDIFQEKIKEIKKFRGKKAEIISKLLHEDKDFLLYRFAANRALTLETEDFKEEEIENWPSFLFAIWNDPDKQLIAIQERKEAFSHTESAVRAFEKTINFQLVDRQLRIYIEPLFKEEAFWKIIQNYQNRIKEITFELITPNMANISEVLSDELKDFAKGTNTGKTKLAIASDPESALNIKKDNTKVDGLVKYSSEGGGNISVKVSGVKRRIQTSRTKKSFEIGEIEINSNTVEEISTMIRNILHD